MKYYTKEIIKQVIDSTIYKYLNKYIIKEIVDNNKYSVDTIVEEIVTELIDKKEIFLPKYRMILKNMVSTEIKINFQTVFNIS